MLELFGVTFKHDASGWHMSVANLEGSRVTQLVDTSRVSAKLRSDPETNVPELIIELIGKPNRYGVSNVQRIIVNTSCEAHYGQSGHRYPRPKENETNVMDDLDDNVKGLELGQIRYRGDRQWMGGGPGLLYYNSQGQNDNVWGRLDKGSDGQWRESNRFFIQQDDGTMTEVAPRHAGWSLNAHYFIDERNNIYTERGELVAPNNGVYRLPRPSTVGVPAVAVADQDCDFIKLVGGNGQLVPPPHGSVPVTP